MRKRLRRPSPSLALGVVALFVALGGTSYAAIVSVPSNSVGTAQLKNGAVTASKINKSAWLSPVIYAAVNSNVTVPAGGSKGITASMVHLRGDSAFCFSHLPFMPKGGSVTINYGGALSNGDTELAQLEISAVAAPDCKSGEHVEVATASSAGNFAPESFYIVLYG